MAQVDIPGLARVGDTVEQSAISFDRAFDAHAVDLCPGGVLDGWASGAALPGTAKAWGAFMRTLAGQVRDYGMQLTKAAKEYEATDQAAAGRVTTAGNGVPADHVARGRMQAP